MNVMRFVGRTSRDAMRKLRDALGPDALVLANRPCAEGVELLAAAPDALGEIRLPAEAPRGPAPAAQRAVARSEAAIENAPTDEVAAADDDLPPMSTVSFQDYVRQRLRERARSQASGATADAAPRGAGAPPTAARTAAADRAEAAERGERAERSERFERPERAKRSPSRADDPSSLEMPVAGGRIREDESVMLAPAAPIDRAAFRDLPPRRPAADAAEILPERAEPAPTQAAPPPVSMHGPESQDALVNELQSLKGVIARQFATISWFEGVRRSPVQGRLLRSMVAAGFSLKLARSVVARLPSDFVEQDAQPWLEQVLARNLRCEPAEAAFERGGVYALIGPTGVGKTTTVAKIAGRHVLANGAQSVVLITVDTYRLGAHDQLRAFGRILGVPVHVAHDSAALHDLLRMRDPRQLVLIDTVGLGHRDERIPSLLLSLPRSEIRHVVVASCSSQAETIDASLRAYEARQAAGVVLTKVDEAARLGGALDCLLRQRLRLLGVCDGQRVPEDWHAAEATRLVRRALLAPPAGAFALDDEELPLVFGVAATLQGDGLHA